MDSKRILTSLIGLPLVFLFMVYGSEQVICFAMMVIGIICMCEYCKVIEKVCTPITWVAILSTSIIYLISVQNLRQPILYYSLPVLMLILFLNVIITEMKISVKDVSYTLLGIIYITGCIAFLSLLTIISKSLLIYAIIVAWSTDIFAYLAGRSFGKHHFSKISPKKTIEGCIVGAIAATIFGTIFFLFNTKIATLNIAFFVIISLVLSIMSQIGDFTASCIKRFADSKDYGNMLPGHGGMLDRIDSLIFIAPFLYMIVCQFGIK